VIGSGLLTSCGGGGGGGGGDSSTGAFTLAATSAEFAVGASQPIPPAREIALTITGSGVAQVGAAYTNGRPDPGWLSVSIDGAAPNFILRLQPNTTALSIGERTAILTVGTADAGNNILATRDVTVRYSIFEGLQATVGPSFFTTAVFGADTGEGSYTVSVTAPGKTWRVTSPDGWLVVPPGTRTGSGAAVVTVNPAHPGITPATTFGSIVVENTANPDDRYPLGVAVGFRPPFLSVSPSPLVVNGADGRGDGTGPVALALDTGANSWPWSATLLSNVAPARLSLSSTSGLVGSTLATATSLLFDRSGLATGRYDATLRITAVVNGLPVTQDIAIEANVDQQRLWVPSNGVALSHFPGRSTVQRSVDVRHNGDRLGIPWTAQSDQPWLSVGDGAGLTGETLTLTADAAGLAPDTFHEAAVTVSSTHPDIAGGDTIRVGFWVGSADPPPNLGVPVQRGDFRAVLETNPVEPWVYSTVGDFGGDIHIHNVHTGALVGTITGRVSAVGAIAVSSDGRRLLATDVTQLRTVILDAASGALLQTLTPPAQSTSPIRDWTDGAHFFRPNGRELVWTAFKDIHDPASGQLVAIYQNGSLASLSTIYGIPLFSADGRRYVERSLDTLYYRRLGWSNVPSPRLNTTDQLQVANLFGAPADVCLSGDGERVAGRATFEDGFHIRSLEPWQLVGFVDLPGAFYATCSRGGTTYVVRPGSTTPGVANDVFVVRPDATVATTLGVGSAGYVIGGLSKRLSGDETRLVTFENAPAGRNLLLYTLPAGAP
jgi:hypothetical protein